MERLPLPRGNSGHIGRVWVTQWRNFSFSLLIPRRALGVHDPKLWDVDKMFPQTRLAFFMFSLAPRETSGREQGAWEPFPWDKGEHHFSITKPLIPLWWLLLFSLYFRFFSTSSRKGFKATDPSSGIWRDLLWSSGGNKCPPREYWYETWA